MTDFNSAQYKRVMAACKERDKFPTQAWIPDEVKKECVHTQLHEAQDVKVNFGVFEQHTDAMRQQSELIEHWVKKEEEYARKEAKEKG